MMGKRLCVYLLVIAMLFTSVDFTVLAAESEVVVQTESEPDSAAGEEFTAEIEMEETENPEGEEKVNAVAEPEGEEAFAEENDAKVSDISGEEGAGLDGQVQEDSAVQTDTQEDSSMPKEDEAKAEEVGVQAAEADEGETVNTSGTFGVNNKISWSYDESTGILTFTGEDEVDNKLGEESPFKAVCDNFSVKKIVAENCKLSGSLFSFFEALSNVEEIDLSGLDTKDVTDMAFMFSGNSSLTTVNVSKLDTGNVTDMIRMFSGCASLSSLDLENFETQKVEDMGNMFSGCEGLKTLNLDSFNTAKVKNMCDMFYRCEKLTALNLNSFDTSNVKDMSSMFHGCESLVNLDLSSFDTSNVTDMMSMFYECTSLENLNLSSFNLQKVEDVRYMFSECDKLKVLYAPKEMGGVTVDLPGTFYDENDTPYTKLSADNAGKLLTTSSQYNAYRIRFDGNGADQGDMQEQSALVGMECKLSANTYKRAGYVFDGWNTEKDGSGTSYGDKASVKDLTGVKETVTLYAQWKAVTYTVRFDGNGATEGSMEDITGCIGGQKYTLTKNTYKKAEYKFDGWNTKADGTGTSYPDGAQVENLTSEDGAVVVLYARWSGTKYTITYVLNGGENSPANPTSYNDLTKSIPLEPPTKTGYDFWAWYSDPDFENEVKEIAVGTTGNLTLYAKWDPISYMIKFDGNGATEGRMDTMSCDYDKKYTLTENVFKKIGYTFACWNTKADGTGEVFADKGEIENYTAEHETITLYAQWISGDPGASVGMYVVTFTMMGHGSPISSQAVAEGSKIKEPSAPSEKGYFFGGWYRDAACTVPWKFETDLVTGNMTLFAQWIVDEDDSVYEEKDRIDLIGAGGVIAQIKSTVYSGKAYKPSVKVTVTEKGKKKTLTEGSDYRVIYENNINAGTGRVTVKGNNTYKGTLYREFLILPKSISKLKVVTGSVVVGSKEELPVYLYDGAKKLVSGKDYSLSYSDSLFDYPTKSAGVTINGQNNYKGSKTVNLKVSVASTQVITPQAVTLNAEKAAYTGKAITTVVPTVKVNGVTLSKNKDYTVKYQNNKEAGTAFVVVKGKGAYSGTVVMPFEITAYTGVLYIADISTKTYNGKLQKPVPTVKAKSKKLKKGKDFIATYTQNFHVGTAYIDIVGIGNYAGLSDRVSFNIKAQKISKATIKGKQGALTVTYEKRALKQGVDFKKPVYNMSSLKKKKIKVTLEGMGDFTGRVTKKVTADPSWKEEDDNDDKEQDQDKEVSGSYENITWKISKDGKLTVTGSGEFSTSSGTSRAPWYEHRNRIITAEVNVKDMKDASYMFGDCAKLTFLDMSKWDAKDLTTAVNIFAGCSILQKISTPYNLSISVLLPAGGAENAWYDASGMAVLSLPENQKESTVIEKRKKPANPIAGISFKVADVRDSKVEKTLNTDDGKQAIYIFGGMYSCGPTRYDLKGLTKLIPNMDMNKINIFAFDISDNMDKILPALKEDGISDKILVSKAEQGSDGFTFFKTCRQAFAPEDVVLSTPFLLFKGTDNVIYFVKKGGTLEVSELAGKISEGGLQVNAGDDDTGNESGDKEDEKSEKDKAVETKLAEVYKELKLSGLTAIEKIETIYDYVTHNVKYDSTAENRYTIYGALIDQKAVCEGYALLLEKMMNDNGIKALYISGIGLNCDGGPGRHAWNIVEYDGLYYNMDATWDASNGMGRTWFMKSSVDFEDHVRDAKYDTEEFQKKYPVAKLSYGESIDLSEYANSEYTFDVAGGGKVSTSTAEDGKIAVLVFGRTTCFNTQTFLTSLKKSELVNDDNVKIIFADIQQHTEEEVLSFKDECGSDSMYFCYDSGNSISGAINNYYKKEYAANGSYTLPLVAVVDSNNKVRFIRTHPVSVGKVEIVVNMLK